MNQTAIQYSVINITLHKVVGGNYPTHPISHEEFDRIEPNIQPIEDTKKSPHDFKILELLVAIVVSRK